MKERHVAGNIFDIYHDTLDKLSERTDTYRHDTWQLVAVAHETKYKNNNQKCKTQINEPSNNYVRLTKHLT